ncbi:uncharacterized protein LOC133782904 [Humulus lupulus]|uniref:uncharacterized protein LOC133782904 n=1 Tax=Humulus lupulus TaxID=3486 RepID=UPI002B403A65|nr:uncharacterized protein LOC133782904 [Humulus lupulus]XP_062078336.1 uncharacterized protein LOC133782904 [Humulus lupulus]
MSEKMTNQMIGRDTTSQIWNALSDCYTAQNRAKISQFQTLLRNTCMIGSLSEYLLKIKNIVDILASIGHKTSEQDHIEAIFNGLTKDYEVFITSVNTRNDPYTVAGIEALLMAQEVRIDKGLKELDITTAEANLAPQSRPNTSRGNYNNGGSRHGYSRGSFSHSGFPSQQFRNSTSFPNTTIRNSFPRAQRGMYANHGSSRAPSPAGCSSFTPWGQKSQCQLCHKKGHSVKTCFYCFDKSMVQNPFKASLQLPALVVICKRC